MFNKTLSLDAQRLPFALQTAMLFGFALCFADQTASEAGSGGKPQTSSQARTSLRQPLVDVSNMSEDEVRAKLQQMLDARGTDREAVRTIRFNDGTEPTFYASGEALPGGKKVGDVKSARDSGTLSIYGFGRNPISLYANQWLELLQFGPDIVAFIESHQDAINEYVRKAKGDVTGKRDVNGEAIEKLMEWYTASGDEQAINDEPVHNEAASEGENLAETTAAATNQA